VGRKERDRAATELATFADQLAVPSDTTLLTSRWDGLPRLAWAGGYDILAVGARGRGLSRAILGSVATRLTQGSPVPLLIVGSSVPLKSEGSPSSSPEDGSASRPRQPAHQQSPGRRAS
jgi:nucleotide-binding universal stress UspA family protein